MNLINKNVDMIFYPCLPYEVKEYEDSTNHYNCPMVTSYPEVIKNNMDILKEQNILFMNPFLPFDNKRDLRKDCMRSLKDWNQPP